MAELGPLILCVDDTDGARYAITRTLQRHGFRTIEAATGLGALEKMKERPDLVILDVQLPDLNGYEVCQRIRRDPATAGTPVLQISADFVDVEHRNKGLEVGADAYLAHPKPPELVATIRSLLRARRADDTARRAVQQLESTFDAIGDGICLLDAEGNVVRANQGLARLLEAPLQSFAGRSYRELLRLGEADPVQRMLVTRTREAMSLHHRGKWLRLTADPVIDGPGRLTGAVLIFSNFTAQQQAQEERELLLIREQSALATLRATETRLKRLADSNMFGVIEADLDGRVHHANDTWLRMLGLRREDLDAGRIRWDLLTPVDCLEADANAAAQIRERGACAPYTKEYQRADGIRVPVLVGAARMEGRDAALAFVLDLTEVKRRERELRGKVRELQTTDQRKDEFLAMLAHELRNPLAAITTGMHLLDEIGSHEGKPVQTRATILRQVGMLTRLVDDLLDVSRITLGKVDLRREKVPLREAVLHAAVTARPLLDERRHQLALELSDEPLLALADPTRLEQVIGNLINNAAKYTEAGGHISVTLRRDGAQALLTVRDTGIGIDPAHLASVFDLFAQVDQSTARTRGGLGVGLTLVKRLVTMHGGSVEARSRGLGTGSEFEVRLPLVEGEPQPASPRPGSSGPPPAEPAGKRRLLLIEDNPDIGETLRDLLQLLGHRCEWVSDGLRGLDLVLATQPDLALVDIGLPGIDGYEVARRVRASEKGKGLLLIALTGYGRPEDRRKSFEAGFDAHLVKPVDPDELTALIAKLSAGREAVR